ncbi:MAG: 23S rRNA (guanosine(2251)-2'-O)-methyltransferase RlmB [Oscillospiraceae bacterium]|nr:23S rRNA (guanosine(2251)-2'-O)-methyltransferase RlmB [Oscillospiraceae bacterium]
MGTNADKDKNALRDLDSGIIYGKNAVVELLKSDSPVDTVYIEKEMQDSLASYYIALANNKKAIVKRLPSIRLDNICGDKHHQGIAAAASFCNYCTVDEILERAREKNENPFIILTDGIEDPHNLGAIIRTAECAGAHGVIIPKRGNVAVNATVHRASAGASSHIKIARVSNLANEIRKLKKNGLFFYCADMDGANCFKSDLNGPIGLIIGSEGYGVSRLVKDLCDGTVSLPMYGKVNSLNASAAASALVYEIIRQRNFKE